MPEATPQPTPQPIKKGTQVWADKHIGGRTVIEDGDTLDITVDGTEYNLQLPPGEYVTSHERFVSTLTEMLNDVLIDAGVPIRAIPGGIHHDDPKTVLVFEHLEKEAGHKIENVGGTAAMKLYGSKQFEYEAK